jgi:hypothetical protein
MANRIFVTEGTSEAIAPEGGTTEARLKKIEEHMRKLRAEGVTIPKRGEVDTGSATYKAAFAKGYNSVKPTKTGDSNGTPTERDGHPVDAAGVRLDFAEEKAAREAEQHRQEIEHSNTPTVSERL